jgi:hypothetical protein
MFYERDAGPWCVGVFEMRDAKMRLRQVTGSLPQISTATGMHATSQGHPNEHSKHGWK